jgi:hypothetical protein
MGTRTFRHRNLFFMRGFIKGKTPEQQKKIDEFRAANKWLFYTSMLLGAIMFAELYLKIMELINK